MELTLSKQTLNQIRNLIVIVAVIGIGIVLLSRGDSSTASSPADTSSVQVNGSDQVVGLSAKGGYSPRNIQAKAGLNTILRISTNKTFDCSTSMRIPKLNIQKVLPPTGNTDIALGTQPAGTQLTVICSMGMYSSTITFI